MVHYCDSPLQLFRAERNIKMLITFRTASETVWDFKREST